MLFVCTAAEIINVMNKISIISVPIKFTKKIHGNLSWRKHISPRISLLCIFLEGLEQGS